MAASFPIFQPIFMILVSKFMVHRVLSDKTYFNLGLLSPLRTSISLEKDKSEKRLNRLCQFVLIICRLLFFFFKKHLFQEILHKYHQSVEQFRSRSGPTSSL